MKIAVILLAALTLTGCATVKRWFSPAPSLTVGATHVEAPKDVGKEATIDQQDAHSSLSLHKGDVVTVERTEAQVGQGNAPSVPAKTITTYRFDSPSDFLAFDTHIKAGTGTTDQTLGLHAQDIASRMPLLYVSIAAGLIAILFVYLSYPTPAMLCGAAAGVFFLAWKLSDLPPWIWALGAAGLAAGVALYLGHHRGLYEPVPQPTKPA